MLHDQSSISEREEELKRPSQRIVALAVEMVIALARAEARTVDVNIVFFA